METSVRQRPFYLNLSADRAFKRTFSQEEVMLGFLNLVFEDKPAIASIEYINPDIIPRSEMEKQSIFDVLCKDIEGNQFIVEMQNAKREAFFSRMIFYWAGAIRSQLDIGDDYSNLRSVTVIALMNYTDDYFKKMKTDLCLCDIVDHQRSPIDYERIVMLQLPYANDHREECCSDLEKYLSLLKTMPDMKTKIKEKDLPDAAVKLLSAAEYDKLSREEKAAYEEGFRVHDAYVGQLDYARKEGMEKGVVEGIAEGKAEAKAAIARAMKERGIAAEVIISCTGISAEEIERL